MRRRYDVASVTSPSSPPPPLSQPMPRPTALRRSCTRWVGVVACVCVWRQPLLPPFLPYPSANSTPPHTHTPNCTPRSLTQHTPHPLAPVDPNLTLPPPVPRLLPPQARVEALRGKLERTRSTSEGLRAAHAELAHSAQKVAHAERKLQDHQAAAAAAAGGKVGGPHGRVGAGGEGGGEGAFRPRPPRPPPQTPPPPPPLLLDAAGRRRQAQRRRWQQGQLCCAQGGQGGAALCHGAHGRGQRARGAGTVGSSRCGSAVRRSGSQ